MAATDGTSKKRRSTKGRQFMPVAREDYERGASVRYLRRRYHMSRSELEDCCPEEFAHEPEPEGSIGGY